MLIVRQLASVLVTFFEQHPQYLVEHIDISKSLDLIQNILFDPSLVVSIPALYIWTRLLDSRAPPVVDAVAPRYGALLEICSKRVLKYGNLPEDSQDETFRFLFIDFDTMPERHAFAGNYRRYCSEIIEKVVRTSPFEALDHFLNQTNSLLSAIPSDEGSVDEKGYSSNNYTALRVDAQCTAVASSVKSYTHWLSEQKAGGKDQGPAEREMRQNIELWCRNIQSKSFRDPNVQKRVLQLVGEVARSVCEENSPLPLSVFESVLGKIYTSHITQTTYGEALKEMNFGFTRLLQKMVMRFPNTFYASYTDVEGGVGRLFDAAELDRRAKMDLRATLFLIIHRAPMIDEEERLSRIKSMMEVVLEPWRDPSFTNAATSFEGFCRLLNLQDLPDYFLSRKAQTLEDWSSVKLDQQGFDMRATITDRLESLPLHMTRSILTVSTDKVRTGSKEFQVSAEVWDPCIPVILPTLLPLLTFAHGFGNSEEWTSFPPELQPIIHRILVDRVWQSGISSETRDDFYNRVRESRSSLEGLASAIRAAVRGVRELSYWILHCFSQFGEPMFRHLDLAEPLARALYDNAHALSSHQVSTLIQISQAIIDGCPVHRHHQFLPPLLTNLYKQVDRKLTSEWEQMDKRERSEMNDETLDHEMKAESVLRQLSYAAVSLAATLLQTSLPNQRTYIHSIHPHITSITSFAVTHEV